MKRILCLIDGMGSGGAQRQIAGLSDLLVQQGYDVELAYYHDPNFYSEFLISRGIKVTKLPLGSNKLSKLKVVYSLINNNTYDTVISYMEGPSVICCILKIFGKIKHLIVSERNTTQRIRFSDRVRFFLYRYANHIVPNSYSQELFINENFENLSLKVKTITNFVDTDFFSPNPSEFKKNDIIKILVVGRINEQKNIPTFLKAIKLVAQRNIKFKVLWYGDYDKANGGELVYENVLSLRQKEEVEQYIEFYPATKQIVEKYRECDVFCLPSLYEGFPNVLCEAMCCGKPVICSNVCDNPSIVQHGINGYLFNPKNSCDIADAIIKICTEDEEKLILMGKYSREIALKKFSSVSFISQYLELI